ncbi:DUF6132 family protein [Niabella pedocola]|uniref:DUF6132 family protein n=1 Tax=Niabella pedocola TaxID=1752077 RepID=A0ABS8PP67_9BACT|nr:DUF6132 family protein [Niabella pedocola]MCD2422117.1 DUF6132 family protein [Niabella pedocola]
MPSAMKKFAKSHLLVLAGMVAGAIAGYCYWKFIGCSSGSCVISSKPLNSAIYGAVMGGLLFSIFKKKEESSHDIQGND